MPAKKTLQDCHDLAAAKGGKCLSVEYTNARTKYTWQCSEGHLWEANYDNILQDHWCPECGGTKPKTLQDCYYLSELNNGKCLSLEYKNAHTKLLWECHLGHKWDAIYSDIQQGCWCPECGYLTAAKNSNNGGIIFHWKTGEELVWTASYERKVVDYLNKSMIEFLWQPKTFITPIKTNKGDKFSTYRPDLYLSDQDLWIEIKGYMRPVSKEKWNWFHEAYPNSELWNKNKLIELGILTKGNKYGK